MVCPLHEDKTRSGSLNVDKGVFFCQAGCGGMTVTQLLRRKSEWYDPPANGVARGGYSHSNGGGGAQQLPSEGTIAGWQSRLMSDPDALSYLHQRGLRDGTLEEYEIGFNGKQYTIPVRDLDGTLLNIRFYDPSPSSERRKIWGVTGHNDVVLYPMSILHSDPDRLGIVEGEWDALLSIQEGFLAITRTGAADTWPVGASEMLAGRRLWICHDKDDKGDKANRQVARTMGPVSEELVIVDLPYEHQPKHGKDLTDFWLEHERADFEALLAAASPAGKRATPGSDADFAELVEIMESSNAERLGKPVKLIVTIKGRMDPGYTVPREVLMACDRMKGQVCNVCPLNAAGGEARLRIEPDDPMVLGMVDATTLQLEEELRKAYGVPVRCNRIAYETQEYQAVEMLFARPSVDHSDGTKASSYKTLKITSVGRHNTLPNNTVEVLGSLQPNPRSQKNEFQVWEIKALDTSVDHFELNDHNIELMRRFQAQQDPLRKLGVIARELASTVTFIHGRPEMHALMDLTFHSVLGFKLAGEMINRGWLESLVVGDTRTGKSAAAERLVRHYQAGEIIGGETASLAGLVGGLQQLGGKDWAVTWGVIPINDRRLVVIDELSGLPPEDISRMSDIRGSGIARLAKIQHEVTLARTRLLWLGNPRNADMGFYTYGVDALKPLIGNPEDIARFDLAMAVTLSDVASEKINTARDATDTAYTSEACHTLLMWCWTRQPDQIVWAPGAEERVFELANEMGKRYVENPPLVQAANIRVKIARTAAALAARLFSTDKDCELVLIQPVHVEAAVNFMDRIYGMRAFGYLDRSEERLRDLAEAEAKKPEIEQYLFGMPKLARYLKSTGKFRRQDLEEVLDMHREEANTVISTLWEARMVRKDLGDIRVEPTLHALLREHKF